MEPTSFELTPEQKGFLEALSRQTGKPVATLIAEALQGLEAWVHPDVANGNSVQEATDQPEDYDKPFWETFIEASLDIPDEELDRLPTDLAAQVDHYSSYVDNEHLTPYHPGSPLEHVKGERYERVTSVLTRPSAPVFESS